MWTLAGRAAWGRGRWFSRDSGPRKRANSPLLACLSRRHESGSGSIRTTADGNQLQLLEWLCWRAKLLLEKRRQESGAKKKKHLPSSSWSLSVSRGSLVTVTLWEWLNCRTVFAVWRASKARAACSRETTAQRPACPALCLHSSYAVKNTFQLVCWLPL